MIEFAPRLSEKLTWGNSKAARSMINPTQKSVEQRDYRVRGAFVMAFQTQKDVENRPVSLMRSQERSLLSEDRTNH